MNEIKKLQSNVIAGILLCVLAASILINPPYGFLNILILVGYVMMIVTLFMKRSDVVFAAGISVVAVVYLIAFFRGFSLGLYSYLSFSYYDYGPHFNIFLMLPSLVTFVAMASAAFISFALLTEYLPKYKDLAKKLWFIPSVCVIISLVLSIILLLLFNVIMGHTWIGGYSLIGFGAIIKKLLLIAGLFFAMLWAVDPTGEKSIKDVFSAVGQSSNKASVNNETGSGMGTQPAYTQGEKATVGDLYCSIVSHALLLVYTFGIWQFIWVYRTTRNTNGLEGQEDRNPTTKLLLYMFVPFYSIYWAYKTAQRIEKMKSGKVEISSNFTTVCLITQIFIPVLPAIIMQDALNDIAAGDSNESQGNVVKEAPVQQSIYAAPSSENMTGSYYESPTANTEVSNRETEDSNSITTDKKENIVEKMTQLKELLDRGIITQEEFDTKKKQLLDL